MSHFASTSIACRTAPAHLFRFFEKRRRDVEGDERETNSEVRQHKTPDDELRRKHQWKEDRNDERTVADGIREKVMKIASIDELEAGSGAGSVPVQEQLRMTGTRKSMRL